MNNLTLKQMIFKYEVLKNDCIEDEQFHEAKICKEIILDLKKLEQLSKEQ